MKLSTQEEYGLRCLLHLARVPGGQSLTIPEISKAEGLSVPNVAKLMRLLRMGGMVQSARGQAGGYTLARPPEKIILSDVLDLLGGQFFSSKFCERHAGRQNVCNHAVDCSLRVLWNTIQSVLHEVLGKITLRDLLCSEHQMADLLACRAPEILAVVQSARPIHTN
ncbi:MAG: Rrf2 family transcriptional regulator [Acidobacteria bacterium]|nr:Rrf2 family transcriptional regulator [Acidobacteriota bacterium]